MSQDPDFFKPIHAWHLPTFDRCCSSFSVFRWAAIVAGHLDLGPGPGQLGLTKKIYDQVKLERLIVHIHQVVGAPEVHLEIDREKARRASGGPVRQSYEEIAYYIDFSGVA